jgi:hypothetical protein
MKIGQLVKEIFGGLEARLGCAFITGYRPTQPKQPPPPPTIHANLESLSQVSSVYKQNTCGLRILANS